MPSPYRQGWFTWRRRADEAAEQDPQLALGILEGAPIVEPRVGPVAKAARMLGYQSAVRRALERYSQMVPS
jgi:hypothetical protein